MIHRSLQPIGHPPTSHSVYTASTTSSTQSKLWLSAFGTRQSPIARSPTRSSRNQSCRRKRRPQERETEPSDLNDRLKARQFPRDPQTSCNVTQSSQHNLFQDEPHRGAQHEARVQEEAREGADEVLLVRVHAFAHEDDGQRAQVAVSEAEGQHAEHRPNVALQPPALDDADNDRDEDETRQDRDPHVAGREAEAVVHDEAPDAVADGEEREQNQRPPAALLQRREVKVLPGDLERHDLVEGADAERDGERARVEVDERRSQQLVGGEDKLGQVPVEAADERAEPHAELEALLHALRVLRHQRDGGAVDEGGGDGGYGGAAQHGHGVGVLGRRPGWCT
ncbi:hypothetical protein ON010_g18211 [Phytophthora cinnamomi]|nr:hypothetical protein ON010_g18211 [Phytophthora cinnamomi]